MIEAIRRKFLANFLEAEFLVVCDVRKERKDLVNDLNSAQVFRFFCGTCACEFNANLRATHFRKM